MLLDFQNVISYATSKDARKLTIIILAQLGTVNYENQVTDPENLKQKFIALRATGVDGVMVDCWWGLVEGKEPQHYNWSGYRQLFNLVRDCGLKLQVCISIHSSSAVQSYKEAMYDLGLLSRSSHTGHLCTITSIF